MDQFNLKLNDQYIPKAISIEVLDDSLFKAIDFQSLIDFTDDKRDLEIEKNRY